MASSSNPSSSATAGGQEESYSAMSVGDVEAIGARCQMPFCRQLDFLPFKCESCKGQFCLDHRTESSHTCPQAGAWARRRAEANGASTSSSRSSPKPNILTHEQQCASASCKTLIHTALVTGVHCDRCRRDYCLKHRFQQDHDCSKLTPLGLKVREGPTQKEKGLAALDRLRAWGSAKKASGEKKLQTKTQASAAARIQQTAQLKRTAKGDDKVPIDKRVYLYVEASSDTITAKIPKGNFFYNAEFSVGRILDLAAKSLQVQNLNNRSEKEEDKLRVFHVEGGRLLEFGEQLGKTVQTGNTIVLLRGVGPGMAQTPEQTAA